MRPAFSPSFDSPSISWNSSSASTWVRVWNFEGRPAKTITFEPSEAVIWRIARSACFGSM